MTDGMEIAFIALHCLCKLSLSADVEKKVLMQI